MDALVKRLSRAVAQRTSRRGFLGYLGKALVGGRVIPLLPINRVVEQAGGSNEGR
jgi:methylamine dehydrogenase light chain